MQKVLIHICCAPCLIGSIMALKQLGKSQIEGLFYNPNIHPLNEFQLRQQTLKEYINSISDIKVHYIDYDPRDYFLAIKDEILSPLRCFICWQLRLEKTAQFARGNNFSAFTSTLLVSPYQNQEKLKELGEIAGEKYGVRFIFDNFRRCYL